MKLVFLNRNFSILRKFSSAVAATLPNLVEPISSTESSEFLIDENEKRHFEFYTSLPVVDEHFRHLLQRFDKCQGLYSDHQARFTRIEDAAFVVKRTLEMRPNISICRAANFISSTLRLILDYDRDMFEKYIGSRDTLFQPLLELRGGYVGRSLYHEFVETVSLFILAKERKRLDVREFEAALAEEISRKCATLDSLSNVIQLVEASYRLFGESDARFRRNVEIFSRRAINAVIDQNIALNDYASLCYFLTLQAAPTLQHTRLIRNRLRTRLRKCVYHIDIECVGMMCHFLNLPCEAEEISHPYKSLKALLKRWLHEQSESGAVTPFTAFHVRKYSGDD